jgi:hypothetical protein
MFFMKRKLFTLLLASVALVAFQANAQQTWWILADTTGLAANTDTSNDKYPANKSNAVVGLNNWLTVVGENIKVHAAVADQRTATYEEGVKAKFKLENVNTNNRLFRIRSVETGKTLSQQWGSENSDNFEIVQFDTLGNTSGKKEAKQLNAKNEIQGYLAWPSSTQSTSRSDSADLVLLGADKNGVLSLKKFSEWGAHQSLIPNDEPWSKIQYRAGFDAGKLYLSNVVPYYQTYTKNVSGADSTLINPVGTVGGNAINWNSGNHTEPFAYSYLDLKLTADGEVYKADGTTKIGLDSLVRWFHLNGNITTLDTVTDVMGGSGSAVADRLYFRSVNGKLEVTSLRSDGKTWTNDKPGVFGGKSYFLKKDATHAPLLSIRIIMVMQSVLEYVIDTNPTTNRGDNYLYKNEDDSWRPIYINAIESCDPVPYEYVTAKWLADEKYDIAAVKQTIVDGDGTSFSLNDINGFAGASSEDAAKFLFESAGKTGTISQWANANIELFNVKNQAGQYLTILKKSTFTNVSTPDSTITNLQLSWTTKESDLDANRQKFAIVRDKSKDVTTITLLPAASYKWIAASPDPIYGGKIYYNDSIGLQTNNACGDPFVNLKKAWYLTQLSKTGSSDQKLIIADPTAAQTSNEIIWLNLELDLNYGTPECRSVTISDKNGYYTQSGVIKNASDATINAHWVATQIEDGSDKGKWKFKAEVDSIYPPNVTIPVSPWTDKYIILATDDAEVFELVSGAQSPYKRDTVKIECIGHSSPFLDLAKLDLVGATAKVAILESLYKDRNISYYTTDINKTDEKPFGNSALESSIRKVTDKDSYSWVTVYQSNERYLGKNETHKVPYYVFSYKNEKGDEYFLSATQGSTNDSVRWVKLNATDRENLLDYGSNYAKYSTYKFCLPFTDGEDHNGAGALEHPVYLQTLDATKDAIYQFVKTSKESGLLDSENVEGLIKVGTSYDKSKGIYSLLDNYATNMATFSSWVFIPEGVVGAEWLEVKRVVDAEDGKGDGVITNINNIAPGTTFIAPSAPNTEEGEANYGILTDINRDIVFTLAYKGQGTIGYEKTPIWYYNIIDKSGKYLTDAKDSTDAKYQYVYSTTETSSAIYTYAFFTPDYYGGDEAYDTDFHQTFGLKLLNPGGESFDFVIVSQAKGNIPTYRYLGAVRERLVFVSRLEDALKLRWGAVEDGKFTGVGVVGAAGIYGVIGGVKLVNATGAVAIYSIDGRLVKSSDVVSPDQTIAVPAGIYIVKNGASVAKVLVK